MNWWPFWSLNGFLSIFIYLLCSPGFGFLVHSFESKGRLIVLQAAAKVPLDATKMLFKGFETKTVVARGISSIHAVSRETPWDQDSLSPKKVRASGAEGDSAGDEALDDRPYKRIKMENGRAGNPAGVDPGPDLTLNPISFARVEVGLTGAAFVDGATGDTFTGFLISSSKHLTGASVS